MNLSSIDWIIIILFFVGTLIIGLWASKKAGQSSKEFFLSGRSMPWWLIGVSMVATTFSADTPNLVTNLVRKHGVAGNWAWWAFLLTGMATVFIYAKLWRRSGITTDLEFYELRYGGKEAAFLRGFRAIYLGVFFNVLIMAGVMLAGIKIASVMLGMTAMQTVLLVSLVTVVYSSLGGLRGVMLTDFFQFILSMIGMVAAAIFIIQMPEIDGLSNLINHPNVSVKSDFIPDLNDPTVAIPLFFVPLAVQWWSVWYPGAEPGGGGYVAQRMLSAKDEKDATKATLLFNIAHYALRPWPWILIALASLIIFPDLESIRATFPLVDASIIQDDIAFSAMLTLLPSGLLGLVIASLTAALMSTISTHLNWGSSYVVHDFYLRFIDRNASDKQQVLIGRLSTILIMILSALLALYLSDALEAFNILLQIGAGTGLLFILRWFWWRINAYSEITAMVVSFLVAVFFKFILDADLAEGEESILADHEKLVIGVIVTTISWIVVTFLTKPTDNKILQSFFEKIRPHDLGWKPISKNMNLQKPSNSSLGKEIAIMMIAVFMVYAILFGVGFVLYGNLLFASICFVIGFIFSFIISYLWKLH